MKKQAVQTILALIHVNVILVMVAVVMLAKPILGMVVILAKDVWILTNVRKELIIATSRPNVTTLMVVLVALV